jgi:hypothetical protein
MRGVILLVAALVVPLSLQQPAKQALPKKAGIFAMTPQGAVELKVSGEPNQIDRANGVKCYYPPDSFDRIPSVESVESFFVNMMDWAPRDLYIVVGRDRLTNPTEKYQRLNGRAVNRGPVAFRIVADDLSPAFLAQAARRLSPTGTVDEATEVYLVLELRSTAGLNDRAYPVRIRIPKS